MCNSLKHLCLSALAVAIGFSMASCDTGGGPFPNDTTTITVMGMPSGDKHGVLARLFLFADRNDAAANVNPGTYIASGYTVGAGPNPAFVMHERGVPVFVSGPYFIRLELHPSEHTSANFESDYLYTTRIINIRRTTIIQLTGDFGWQP